MDGVLRIWDIEKNKKQVEADRPQTGVAITALAFNPSGRYLIAGLDKIGLFFIYESY